MIKVLWRGHVARDVLREDKQMILCQGFKNRFLYLLFLLILTEGFLAINTTSGQELTLSQTDEIPSVTLNLSPTEPVLKDKVLKYTPKTQRQIKRLKLDNSNSRKTIVVDFSKRQDNKKNATIKLPASKKVERKISLENLPRSRQQIPAEESDIERIILKCQKREKDTGQVCARKIRVFPCQIPPCPVEETWIDFISAEQACSERDITEYVLGACE